MVSDVCLMHTYRQKLTELVNCEVMLHNSKRWMFDMKTRSIREGSD